MDPNWGSSTACEIPGGARHYIGFGANAAISRCGTQAIKQPRQYAVQGADDRQQMEQNWLAEVSASKIQHEKKVYHQLGDHDGIVKASFDLHSDDPTISMPYMSNRSLDHFLLRKMPEVELQLAWARQLVNIIAYCHKQNVLIGDVGSRNCLLDADFSLKLCDFGDSSIIEAGCDISEANDFGVTVKTDIAKVGVVLYEICTGQVLSHGGRQEPNFNEDITVDEKGNLISTWPSENLPSTDGLLFGDIIRKCWTKVYGNMEEVANDLPIQV